MRASRAVRVLVVVAALFALAFAVAWSDARKGKTRGDFTRYSLAASRVLYEGGNPYAKGETGASYKYFPINAVLLWPFTLVPIPIAQGFWTSLNIGLLGCCLYMHRRMLAGIRIPWWVWALALSIAFRLFVKNLRLGQWNTSVYCLAFLGIACLPRRRLAGALSLALAAALKYMPAFLLLYLVARRDWKSAGATAIAMAFWILIVPTVVLGPQRHLELLQNFRERAAKHYGGMTQGEFTSSLSLRSTIVRMTSDVRPRLDELEGYDVVLLRLDRNLARALGESAAIAILGAALLFTVVAFRRRTTLEPGHRDLLLVGLWFLVLLMISPEARSPHFLTTFTPSFALAATVADNMHSPRIRRLLMGMLVAGIVLLNAPSELFEGATYNLLFTALGFHSLSTIVLAAAIVCAVATAWRQGPGLEDEENAALPIHASKGSSR